MVQPGGDDVALLVPAQVRFSLGSLMHISSTYRKCKRVQSPQQGVRGSEQCNLQSAVHLLKSHQHVTCSYMPKLSDYLQRELVTTGAHSEQPAVQSTVAAVAVDKHDAVAKEVATLHRAYSNRVRDHGARVYRQPDGSLAPHPPAADPYTVANRRRWSGLVKHCRQQPGVDMQLERTGVSARYDVGVTYEEHATALAAIGLAPEFNATGHWHSYDAARQDQLRGVAAASHPLADEEWRDLTELVLQRAMQLHGADTIHRNGWQDLLQAVQTTPGGQVAGTGV